MTDFTVPFHRIVLQFPHRTYWNFSPSTDTTFIETTTEGFSIGGNALYLDNELRNGVSVMQECAVVVHVSLILRVHVAATVRDVRHGSLTL